VLTDFLALRLFCFNIHQHSRQILYFKLHVDGRKFYYRRSHVAEVVHRCTRAGVYNLLLLPAALLFLHEVWPPMNSSYIYDIRLIKE